MFGLKKGTLLLFFSFMAITICFVYIISTLRIDRENRLASRHYYSENVKAFGMSEVQDKDFWIDFYECNESEYTIYNQLVDEFYDIRGVMSTDSIVAGQIISGRFFDENDYKSDKKTIVVGSDFSENIYEDNGVEYFDYLGDRYEVIGIVGAGGKSRVNHMLFIDFISSIEADTNKNAFYVDSNSPDTVDEVVSLIKNKLQLKCPEAEVYYSSEAKVNSGLDLLFGKQKITGTLYGLFIICFMISTIMVTYIWISYRQKYIAIMLLTGFCQKVILVEIIRMYFRTVFVSYIVAAISTLIIGTSSLSDLWKALILTIFFGVVALIVPMIKMLQSEIASAMR